MSDSGWIVCLRKEKLEENIFENVGKLMVLGNRNNKRNVNLWPT